MGLIIRLAAFISLAAVLVYVGNTLGYRLGLMEFRQSFGFSFMMVMPLLIIGGVTAVLGLLGFFTKRAGSGLFALVTAALVFACAAGPMMIRHNGSQVPPIHDITTDTIDPPQFIAVVPLREASGASNPAAYDNEQTGQQLEAYPDLATVTVTADYPFAFDTAVQVLQDMGLELVDVDEAAGRIEATHTSTWWGFKDDVVVRFNRGETPLTVDMRSKSRIGRSDVGANAERIRTFMDKFQKALAA